jgi:putative toxin-antitoxin system antitoxin component (TIGR02293 family)
MALKDALNSAIAVGGTMNAEMVLGIKGKKVERRIREGLPYSALDKLLKETCLTRLEVAKALDIPVRTLVTHKGDGKLSPEESDKIYRLARLFGLAVDMTSQNKEEAKNWFFRSRPQLGGTKPIDLVSTDAGAKKVENLIMGTLGGVP